MPADDLFEDGLGGAAEAEMPAQDTDRAPSNKGAPPPARDEAGLKLLSKGDVYRRKGNCGLARLQYEKAKKSFDRNVQARALAGLGLCELSEGNEDAGKRQLKRARSLDPSIDGYIRQQQGK